jgi:cysteine-rich repeat protein
MKKVFSDAISGLTIYALLAGFLFPSGFAIAVVTDENLCEVAADVALVLDVSGSMEDGGAQSKCEWSELKEYNSSYTWFLNKKYNVSEEWCSGVRDSFDESAPSFQFVSVTYTPSINSKIINAKNAAKSFLDNLKSQDQSALVTFSDVARLPQQLSLNHQATKLAIDEATTGGATNMGDAIDKAIQELNSERENPKASKTIILLTDGKANKPNGAGSGEDPSDVVYAEQKAQEAADLGYKIFTIGLGSSSDINQAMLGNIANITGASYHHAPNGSFLTDIYQEISQEICQYGSISGCKYSDLNSNGTIDETEPTLAGWEITLSGDASVTQLTDESGCYTFAGLLEGNYVVSEAENIEKSPFTQTYPIENPYNISLAKGENLTDYNFANYLPFCGNNIIDEAQNEQCDDGNTTDGDGCSAVCQVEPFCGDGTLYGGEQCDDNNTVDGDGCSAVCQVEPFCGDGTLYGGEQCDDNNTVDGDGCSAVCRVEQIEPVCGNNILEEGEQCDDGNTADGDGCSATCQTEQEQGPVCGNITIETGEQCDDGNTTDGDGCSATCQTEQEQGPVCGNSVVEIGEQCDDGNTNDGDGCSSTCQNEVRMQPGDIVINEIIQNPAAVSDSYGEWFELYNKTQTDIDLFNCTIGDGGGDAHVIFSSLIVPANGYVVLAKNGNSLQNGGITPNYVYSGFFLSNVSDKIILNCDGIEIDRVEYDGGPQFPNPNGASMSLADPVLDNNIGSNWCASVSMFGAGDSGTPGAPNDACSGVVLPVCGNSEIESGEQCDDGNTADGDGCSATCQTEQEQGPVCGNITIETGEQCDDGNTADGDGCSATCQTEQTATECLPGLQQTCSAGGLGICSTGSQTCSESGFWGSCVADNTSINEVCNNGLDDDCDGSIDDNDSNCQQGGGSANGGSGGGSPPEHTLLVSDQSITTPNVTENSITFTWTTNYLSSSYIIYSEEGQPHSLEMTDNVGNPPKYGYAYSTAEYDINPKVINHSVTITGLKPSTTYYFRTVSRGSLAISGEYMTKTVSVQTTPATEEELTAVGGPEQPALSENSNPTEQTQEEGIKEAVIETPEFEIAAETETSETVKTGEKGETGENSSFQAGLFGGFMNILSLGTGLKWLSILMMVLLIAVVAYVIFYFFKNNRNKKTK